MQPDDWIGKRLAERYRIEETIGRGGMSVVYKAYDLNLRRAVAIKMIHTHLSSEPGFVNRFKEEATAIARLRHSNIVHVYDLNNEDKTYYIVMEFVPGETLEYQLKRLNDAGRHMPLKDVVKYIADICQAADYAHDRGLIHRDIKPANIMLTIYKEAILMDFGISKIIGGHQYTATGAVIGTALYMSPEQIAGEQLDRRSDIYSLGVTLFEMLCGHPPYQAESAMPIMMMHINDPIPDICKIKSDIPIEIAEITNKALAKEPKDRYDTAGEMASALRSIIEQPAEIPPAAVPPSQVETLVEETPAPIEGPVPVAVETLPVTAEAPLEDGEARPAEVQGLVEEPELPHSPLVSDEEIPTPPLLGKIKPIYLIIAGAVILAGIFAVIFGGPIIYSLFSGSGGEGLPAAMISPTQTQGKAIVPSTPTPISSTRAETSQAPPTATDLVRTSGIHTEIQWTPILYDDFDDPTFDGSFNSSKWDSGGSECQIVQVDGQLEFISLPPADNRGGCFLIVKDEPIGENLITFEADIKVDEFSEDTWWGLYLNHGKGWIHCGIGVNPEHEHAGIQIAVVESNGSSDRTIFEKNSDDIDPYRWNNLRVEIDPDSMSFSCYLNNTLIGSTPPELGEKFRYETFGRYLQHGSDQGKKSLVFVDDVRISSPTMVEAVPSDLITWDPVDSSECQIKQENGMVVVEGFPPNPDMVDCFLNLPGGEIQGNDLNLFEADVKIDEFSGGGWSWVGLLMNYGEGWVACLIEINTEETKVQFDAVNANFETEFEYSSNDVDSNQWNTISLRNDPETMTFSCYLNDQFIGSDKPERADLRDIPFSRYLQIGFGPETRTKILVDYVRRFP